MRNSKSTWILDLIAQRGAMRFTDIQRELYERTHGPGTFNRELRGYWCTNLLGGFYYHAGLLHTFCTKGEDGLWRRNQVPHNGRPWKLVNAKRHHSANPTGLAA